jgi:hypothetical protein
MMPESEFDETRAQARLPNLEIEIVHRQARDGSAEEFALRLRALPSFAALEPLLMAADPMVFWARAMEVAWAPWLALAPPRGRR